MSWMIADAKKRILGGIIDFIIYLAFCWVVLYLFKDTVSLKLIIDFIKTKPFTYSRFIHLLINLSTLEGFLLFLGIVGSYVLIYILMPLMTDGRTLGRLLFGIRIVKLNETRLSFGTLLLREILINFVFTIMTFGLIRIVDLFLVFNGKGRRTLCDRASNTLVMQKSIKIK